MIYWKQATVLLLAVIFAIPPAEALDKNGDFESPQERDAFVAATLRDMAKQMNSQTPIQLDEETRLMSVLALQKTITFNMRLPNFRADQVNPARVERVAKENLNLIVCRNKATRDLIDIGVQYVYLYSGNDGRFVTRVVIDSYKC